MEAFKYESRFEPHPHLLLPIGSELLSEFSSTNQRVKFSLVGMEKGQFLIARAHSNDLMGTFRSGTLEEGNINLSFLHGDTVYGFSSEILSVVSSPARMFFMAYPRKIDEIRVRGTERYECILPAMTMIGHEIFSVVMVDISREGCQCVIRSAGEVNEANPLNDLIQVDKRIDLKVQFPGAGGRKSSLQGVIRTVTRDTDKVLMGVMFKDVSPLVRGELGNFISLITDVRN